jgi:hypothetical protein
MDKYEEMLQKMIRMSPDEKDALLERNRGLCSCPKCPTYTRCMKEKGERMFCWTGKSPCPVNPTGCLCPSCPVAALMGYSKTYYCVNGTEAEVRKAG